MGAMDHREPDPGDGILCIWCHEVWPCTVAKIRRELAEYMRGHVVEVESWAYNPTAAEYSEGILDGVRRTADAIDWSN